MATFKFFNIGKANEEITRLETELAAAKEQAKTATENASEVSKQAEKLQGELTQANSDLSTARTSIESLTGKLTKAEADLAAANAKLANPDKQITEAASRKALEITQAQGIPPITSVTATTVGGTGDILAQHAAIKDPVARMEFYRKNKAAYNAAHRAANPGDFQLGAKKQE